MYACVYTCETEKKKGRECLWVPGDQANLLAGVLDLAFGQQRKIKMECFFNYRSETGNKGKSKEKDEIWRSNIYIGLTH